jgi:hypothetical protein
MKPTHRPSPAAWFAAALALAWLSALPGVASATSPVASPHGSLRAECSLCHGSKGWKPAQFAKSFDHGAYGFRLEGAHRATACLSCHKSLEFAKADPQCTSCHLDPHRGEFGATCERCHTARSFLDRAAMTKMHQETRLPLVGAHLAADCQQCHVARSAGRLQFVGLPAACQGCHMPEYNTARNPVHTTSGFSVECERCHRPLSWTGAAFDHAGTGFPLTGSHRTVACASCHVGGIYAGTSTACVSCHQNDYDATNPSHSSLGFPTTCATCHTTTNWNANFTQHDSLYFPIYSGAHAGRWSVCADCHTQPSNYAVFNCLGCHPHDDKATTDGHHSGVSGYQYLSSACYSCHPQGRN